MDQYDAIPDELRERHGFPKDVWEAACKEAVFATDAAIDLYETGESAMDVRAIIAKAIMAERERCASVAEDETRAPLQHNAKSQWVESIGQRVAKAIRGEHQ